MKKVAYDNDGIILGIYDTLLNTSIPEQVISITELEWQNIIANPTGYRVDTQTQTLMATPLTNEELLNTAKIKKQAYLNNMYVNSTVANFTSDALGVAHSYQGTLVSINLLNALVTAGNTANFYYETNGVLTSVSHTLLQLQQVLTDFITERQSALGNLITKLAAVETATTIEDVNSITW